MYLFRTDKCHFLPLWGYFFNISLAFNGNRIWQLLVRFEIILAEKLWTKMRVVTLNTNTQTRPLTTER